MPSAEIPYYPAFLNLTGRQCVVAGGGLVAQRKTLELLRCRALVTIISPTLTPRLRTLHQQGKLTHRARMFQETDLTGAALVFAATDSPETNARIAAHCGETFVNVVSEPGAGSFILPSTIRRGPLVIALSTSGASPALARALKQDLAERYGPAFGTYLRKLRSARKRAIARITQRERRERYLRRIASPDVVAQLREGRVPEIPPLPLPGDEDE